MKTLARCGFAALIVLSLFIQATRGQHREPDSDPIAVLAAGLERLNVATYRSAGENILTGQSVSCQQPIHAMLLRIDGADAGRLRDLILDDVAVKYVYLGSVEEDWETAAMIARSLWASARFTMGLRSAPPPPNFVVITLPRACPELPKLPWVALSPWD